MVRVFLHQLVWGNAGRRCSKFVLKTFSSGASRPEKMPNLRTPKSSSREGGIRSAKDFLSRELTCNTCYDRAIAVCTYTCRLSVSLFHFLSLTQLVLEQHPAHVRRAACREMFLSNVFVMYKSLRQFRVAPRSKRLKSGVPPLS